MTNKQFFDLYNNRKVRVLLNDTLSNKHPRFNFGDIGIIVDYSEKDDDYPIRIDINTPNHSGILNFNYTELEVIKTEPLPLPG